MQTFFDGYFSSISPNGLLITLGKRYVDSHRTLPPGLTRRRYWSTRDNTGKDGKFGFMDTCCQSFKGEIEKRESLMKVKMEIYKNLGKSIPQQSKLTSRRLWIIHCNYNIFLTLELVIPALPFCLTLHLSDSLSLLY